MTCKQWDVAVVPFPFTDRDASKRRPALALTNAEFNSAGRTVFAMITTATASWPGDHHIRNEKAAGLKVKCKVRLKLFTLENQLILRRIGSLAGADRSSLAAAWSALGPSVSTDHNS
jgi:mRNA interferase MazF